LGLKTIRLATLSSIVSICSYSQTAKELTKVFLTFFQFLKAFKNKAENLVACFSTLRRSLQQIL
jgi:hypothetical protein